MAKLTAYLVLRVADILPKTAFLFVMILKYFKQHNIGCSLVFRRLDFCLLNQNGAKKGAAQHNHGASPNNLIENLGKVSEARGRRAGAIKWRQPGGGKRWTLDRRSLHCLICVVIHGLLHL
jgi:hypothetical protein